MEQFTNNTTFEKGDIKKIQKINAGFSSNQNFKITLFNSQSFQLRIPNQKIDHSSEIKIYESYLQDNCLYINKEGVLIRRWVEGTNPDFKKEGESLAVLNEIQTFHELDIPKGINKFDFYSYENFYKFLPKDLLDEFLKSAKEIMDEPISLLHGDINNLNVIYDGTKAHLIDFEWVRVGPSIIDFASLIAFSEIDIDIVQVFTGYSKAKLLQYTKLILIHAMLWAYDTNTDKSKILLEQIKEKLKLNI